jgi:hypothetical protein
LGASEWSDAGVSAAAAGLWENLASRELIVKTGKTGSEMLAGNDRWRGGEATL